MFFAKGGHAGGVSCVELGEGGSQYGVQVGPLWSDGAGCCLSVVVAE